MFLGMVGVIGEKTFPDTLHPVVGDSLTLRSLALARGVILEPALARRF